MGSSDSKVLLQHLKKHGFLEGDSISIFGNITEDVFRRTCQSLDVINAIAALDDSWLDPLVSFLKSKGHTKQVVENVQKKQEVCGDVALRERENGPPIYMHFYVCIFARRSGV